MSMQTYMIHVGIKLVCIRTVETDDFGRMFTESVCLHTFTEIENSYTKYMFKISMMGV